MRAERTRTERRSCDCRYLIYSNFPYENAGITKTPRSRNLRGWRISAATPAIPGGAVASLTWDAVTDHLSVHGSITSLFDSNPPLDLETYGGARSTHIPCREICEALGKYFIFTSVAKTQQRFA